MGVPVYRTGLKIDAGRRPMGVPVPRELKDLDNNLIFFQISKVDEHINVHAKSSKI